jgi:phage shock protein E
MLWLKQLFGVTFTTIGAQKAQAKLAARPALLVLDVRQPEEYKAGHIAGATLIPLGELGGRIGALPRDREILCVCASGSRSFSAVRQLSAAGLTVFNLQGGLTAWQRAQLPLKKGSAR